MARYSAGTRTGAGSTTLPIISIYSAAAVNMSVVEIGISNTTAVAVAFKLCKLTTAGTQGAGLTETGHGSNSPAASCTAFTTHTGAPTVVDMGYNVTLVCRFDEVAWWHAGQRVEGGCEVELEVAGVQVCAVAGDGGASDAWLVGGYGEVGHHVQSPSLRGSAAAHSSHDANHMTSGST